MADRTETQRVLRDYAEAWLAGDLQRVLGAYHDEIVLHYMGESPLAGTHVGKDAVFPLLGQASYRTSRKLIDIEDVLVGETLGALLATEDLGEPPRRVRRILLYRVEDGQLRELAVRRGDQRFIDALWSTEPDV